MNTQPDALSREELLALTNGHPPHREDGWMREMLPEGWRPLVKGEALQNGDEYRLPQEYRADDTFSPQSCEGIDAKSCKGHWRTRRPAPPKAEEEAENWVQKGTRLLEKRLTTAEQEITRLTRERDDAREAASKSADSCLGLIGERDEANQRAESAESTVSRLEGELAEAKRLEHEALIRHSTCEDEREVLYVKLTEAQKAIASHTWTSTSTRMPTEADADECGFVAIYRRGTGADIERWEEVHLDRKTTHWMKLPLTPAPQGRTDGERERLREELKLTQFRLKAADQGLQELDEENTRFRIALTEIASYDKEKKHGDGICPYGCDTPFIAQRALSQSSWSPWRLSSITPTPSSAGVRADAYLCMTVDRVRPVILTYIYADKQWTFGEGDSQKVLLWMPLPQPPTKLAMDATAPEVKGGGE